ncbi:hypothetical protein ACN38_g8448 [Penicillium nordicum]|uniref:Uncharacterized protein n=1 Tax=Penicillium nordicum TaxID=229535 RepID=A0A0M8P594_9EURO|nr:hypothetical protein ACN38_g8448 [Penicillium nordicum]
MSLQRSSSDALLLAVSKGSVGQGRRCQDGRWPNALRLPTSPLWGGLFQQIIGSFESSRTAQNTSLDLVGYDTFNADKQVYTEIYMAGIASARRFSRSQQL